MRDRRKGKLMKFVWYIWSVVKSGAFAFLEWTGTTRLRVPLLDVRWHMPSVVLCETH